MINWMNLKVLLSEALCELSEPPPNLFLLCPRGIQVCALECKPPLFLCGPIKNFHVKRMLGSFTFFSPFANKNKLLYSVSLNDKEKREKKAKQQQRSRAEKQCQNTQFKSQDSLRGLLNLILDTWEAFYLEGKFCMAGIIVRAQSYAVLKW